MDIEKLIEQLRTESLYADKASLEIMDLCMSAADALEELQAELNAAKSPEVLEAADELMEFARTRMSTADWLYYVDVLGGWRGQKED